MSVGLIQHNFSSKEQLIQYAMELVLNRMEERAESRTNAFMGTKEEALKRLMKFIIPMNPEERMEGKVWIAFQGVAFSNTELLELQHKMDKYTRHLMKIIISHMDDLGYLGSNSNKNFELEMLYAFIDGLVIHTLQTPEHYPEEVIDQLIDYYLTSRNGKL